MSVTIECYHCRPSKRNSDQRGKSTGDENKRRAALAETHHVENEHVHVKRREGYAAAERRLLNR